MAEEVGAVTHKFRATQASKKDSYITAGYDLKGQPTRIFVQLDPSEHVALQGMLYILTAIINAAIATGRDLEKVIWHVEERTEEVLEATENDPKIVLGVRTMRDLCWWLRNQFLKEPNQSKMRELGRHAATANQAPMINHEEEPPCTTCGSVMIREGSGYKCHFCGATRGHV